MNFIRQWTFAALALAVLLAPGSLLGQADQGTITGVVQDPSGAVIGGASVTLTSLDNGQVLNTKTDSAGVYVFSPIKIGNYSVTASAEGFRTTTQTNLHLSVQERLNVVVTLKPGAISESVTVTWEAPLMQTQESSVGQVMDTKTIDSVPLNGRNWVFIAQLAAGAAPPEGSRGGGKGDFNANGQRAEENNFILDGVDNNANVVDFYNGASFVALPPPDGLAEFKVQTSDYSAEFGHSAGAVLNASLKSGTNDLHGSAWEYVRNTALDATDWNASAPLPYHENQFGATLGLPLIRNKLFFFGDVQANRIVFDEASTMTVPSLLERTGDFSELLNPALTGVPAIQLYYQNPATGPQAFTNNNLNSISGVAPSTTALQILNLFPKPNTNNGKLSLNYFVTRPAVDNTFQWDTRMDWNIGPKDTAYSRYSYWNEPGYHTPPLGPSLDGGGWGDDGVQKNLGQNFMLSESHLFTPTLTNEFRVGFNYLHTGFQQPNASNPGFAESIGVGGIPTGTLNGGLPTISVSGISNFGAPGWAPTDEHEDVYQILDNLTKIAGNHAFKAGVSLQSIRFFTLQPQFSRGTYNYNGEFTSDLNLPNTGNGLADFLMDDQFSAQLSNEMTTADARWYYGAYFQDDWRVTQKVTLNLGLRWDYYQPYKEVGGMQASFNTTGPSSIDTNLADPMVGIGTGSGQYLIPKQSEAYANNIFNQTGGAFPTVLAATNINLVYSSDPHLIKAQKTNFAPRIGISFSPNQKFVVRAGYGIFFGGLESQGYWPNLGENYPFQYAGTFQPTGSCTATSCPTDGISLATGFSSIVANGFAGNVFGLFMRGSDPKAKTTYTQDYNLSLEQSITKNTVATVSYVGNSSHHLQVNPDPNAPLALENPNNWAQYARPFPYFAPAAYTAYAGNSNYNGLQAKVEKRLAGGSSLFATYTWSHSLDDAPTPLGTNGDAGYRQSNLIPIWMDYANSGFDTRHRFTFNAFYELPFGAGRRFLNSRGFANAIAGGWSVNATFAAQTGNPFSVTLPPTFTLASGAGPSYGPYTADAVKIGNPFTAGGTFISPNPAYQSQIQCAPSTRNRNHWYNPCAFTFPWEPNDWAYEPQYYIPTGPSDPYFAQAVQPMFITSTAEAVGYIGDPRDEVYGPGYERVNMSIFKDFKVYHEQTLQFRADIFNLCNTPSLGQPSDSSLDSNEAG